MVEDEAGMAGLDLMNSENELHRMNTVSKCPVCATELPGEAKVLCSRDPFSVSDQLFRYEQCNCGSWILNPRPEMDQMGRFYESDFLFDPKQQDTSGGFLSQIASIVQQFNLISEVNMLCSAIPQNSSKVLDYSAGNGQILHAVRRKKPEIEVFATEFSKEYREYIRYLMPGIVVKENLSDFDKELRFDLISAFGVLEHVEFPRELMADFHERLLSGGMLVLSVPNVNSFQRFVFGSKWYSWLAPRHWQMYTMNSLVSMLESSGFQIVTKKEFYLRTASSTLVLSLFPSLDPLQSTGAMRLMVYGLLFYLFLPLEWLFSLIGYSSFIGVTATKISDKTD